MRGTWFVSISVVQTVEGGSMTSNYNETFEAEEEIEAINQAIEAVFSQTEKDGSHVLSMIVGRPRRVE